MSGTIIITKHSTSTNSPAAGSLSQGEQAYSYASQKLFIGDASDPVNGIIIGGKHYTDMLDHTLGILTPDSAILTDASNKINVINIDNITIDGNTITTTDANGNLTLDPNGSGNLVVQGNTDIVGNLTVSGTQTFTGQATFASVNVTDLTDGRVLLAGTAGELEDSGNLTFSGTLLTVTGSQLTTGNATINGTLDVDTSATIATLKVEDLTDNRVVLAGAGGEIEDSANFTFDGGLLTLTGNQQVTGTLNVDSQATLASLNVEDLSNGRITFAGTNGELQDDANLTWTSSTLFVNGAIDVDNIKLDGNTISATDANGDLTLQPSGTGVVTVNTDRALIIASGVGGTRPSPAVVGDGAIRYNETDNRFEGTVSGSWTGLGGVIDRDQDTYVSAEIGDKYGFSSLDDDTLRFVAGSTQEMTITATGVTVTDQITTPIANITTSNVTQANIVTADITGNLEVDGTAVFNNGISVAVGDVGIAENLNVSGNAIIEGDLTVNGTTTAVNSTVTTLNDPVIKLGDGSLAALDLIDRGINFDYGDGAAVQTGFFGFDNASNRFVYKLVADAADEADQDYSAPWGDAQFGNLFIDNNASISGTIGVTGAATLSNTLNVTGVTTLVSNATVGGTFGVTGNTTLSSNATVGGTLGVTGATTLSNTLGVTGATTLNSTLHVLSATDLDTTLNVDGAVTLKDSTTLGSSGQMVIDNAGIMQSGTINGGTF